MSISDADNNNDYSHRSPKNNQESGRGRESFTQLRKSKSKLTDERKKIAAQTNDSVLWQSMKKSTAAAAAPTTNWNSSASRRNLYEEKKTKAQEEIRKEWENQQAFKGI